MSIDTNIPNADGIDPSSDLPIHVSSTDSKEAESCPAQEAKPTKATLEPLLAHLDALFAPLLEKAKLPRSLDQRTAIQLAIESETKPAAPVMPIGPSDEDLIARDKFLASQAHAPLPILALSPGLSTTGLVKRVPRRGLGAPVFIGFDAEWTYKRKGRNRLLSVQFYVIGPTGERHSKVIEFSSIGEEMERPSLAEVLEELLDEAEAYGVFDDWPSEVVLCGFFTLADITIFRDAKDFIKQLKGVNGTLATVGKPAKLKLPMGIAQTSRLKSRYAFTVGGDFDPCWLSVRLVDASRLAPPGASLFKIGEWMGFPKLKLPPGYHKSEMAKLQRERHEIFIAYGLRDAEIAVLYVLWVLWFCDRHLGLKGLSATASGLGVRLAQVCMRRDGVHPDVALNFTHVKHTAWSNQTGRPLSLKKREPTTVRRWFEGFLADAYLGGRNECYWFGPTAYCDDVVLYDHDLAGCYVVSLAGAMVMDYDRIEVVRDKERFKGHVAGAALVHFQFPADTLYPCLPVTVGNYGLWFPLSGTSICTAPEIELAMLMGAEIAIEFGVIIPWMDRAEVFQRSAKTLKKGNKTKKEAAKHELDGDVFAPVEEMQFPPESHGDVGYREFESFAIYTRTERLKYKGKTLPNLFMKLLGNAAYGKTGQGFKNKRGFGPKEMDGVKIGQSAISEAAVAAMTSGFARAVLGEILWMLPAGTLVVSATTDGLLVSIDQLDLTGPMCQRFQVLVNRVAPGTGMTELKHLIGQAVAGKTRLQMTGQTLESEDPVIAKGGIKVLLDSAEGDEDKEKALLSPEGQNSYVLDLFINRYPGQSITRPSLMSMRDVLLNEWDLQTVDSEVKLNMDFDFKRRPVDAQMVRIESHGVEHLAFSTVPWASVEEGELVRTLFDQWREDVKDVKAREDKQGHCLKNMTDWNDWQIFQAQYVGNRQRARQYKALLENPESAAPLLSHNAGMDGSDASSPLPPAPATGEMKRKVTRGISGVRYVTSKTAYLGEVIRMFLAAYVQRAWGLASAKLSQAKLADWLTEAGYPVKVHDVKNAGRSRLYEQVAPGTPEVLAFLAVVKQRFPDLDVAKLFVPIDGGIAGAGHA